MVAIAVIAVTSWVLDVAADAPSLATCKPIDRGGNSVLYAADGEQARRDRLRRSPHAGLDRADPEEPAAGDGGDRGPALLPARRRRHRGHPPRRGQGPRSRRGGRGRLDDHPAAGPQPLHRATRSRTSNARSSRRSWRSSTPNATRARQILGSYLNIASYGTIEGSTAVGVQAASQIYFSKPVWKLSLPQAALLAGLPQAPSEYNPILNPGRRWRRRNEVLRKMAKLGYVSPRPRRGGERERASGSTSPTSYFEHRQPYFFDYVENELIERVRGQHGAPRRPRGADDDRPRPAAGRPGSDALRPPLLDRPLLGAGLDRPPQRPHPGDGLQLPLRREPVQPRRPGPPPAGLDLQGLRPDHGDQAGDRPLLDLLHVETARPRPAALGPLGRSTPPTRATRARSTCSRRRSPPTTPSSPSSTSTSARRASPQTAKSMGITTQLDGIPAEGIGGLRLGVSPLELTDAYATLASGGIHHDPVAIEQGDLPRRPGRPTRRRPSRSGCCPKRSPTR